MEICRKCFEISVDRIRIPADHCRQVENLNETNELVRSITQHGQIDPLIVKSATEKGWFDMIAGARRLRAAKLAGLKKVTCILMDDATSLTSLEENLQRVKLDPLDKAESYHRLKIELGGNQKVLAEKLGKSEASVSATLSLRDLPSEIKARHMADAVLSERQLLILLGMEDLEEQKKAYEKALNGQALSAKCKKNSNGKVSIAEQMKKSAVSLGRKVDKLDLTKVTANDLADFCVLMLSVVSRIKACGAGMSNFDPQATSKIVKSESAALYQTVERLDISHMNAKGLNQVCEQMLQTLARLVKTQNGRVGFNPVEVLTAIGHLIVVLAQFCLDEESLRTFRGGIRDIERKVRKKYPAKFSALNFLRRIVRWT